VQLAGHVDGIAANYFKNFVSNTRVFKHTNVTYGYIIRQSLIELNTLSLRDYNGLVM
jgi:hypothetical protein